MFVLAVALTATVLLALQTSAQDPEKYTVWSSVIFSRTGERTPSILGVDPVTLTSIGAQQQYASGSYFRDRYLTSYGSSNGIGSAPIAGLPPNLINPMYLYIEALDEQCNVASAQAFLQGLYPPFSLTNNLSGIADLLDPTSMLANGTYVEAPMGGYQYAQIHANDVNDAEFPYIGGNFECPAWDLSALSNAETPQYTATDIISQSVYNAVGPVFLSDVLPEEEWNYYNAYAIYDYISFLDNHNVSVNSILSAPQFIDPATNISYLNTLQWYADQQQYAWLGNLEAQNNITSSGWPSGVQGSISTIGGNLLAAKMLGQLQMAIATSGEYYKLSLLFADYQPMMSLFSLASLPILNSNFYGIANYGSVAAFELFSYTNSSDDASDFPSEDELWVRFYFRNGTDSDAAYQAYPMFNNGPDQTDMSWTDFQTNMYALTIGDIGTWCQQCGAFSIFCAMWNTSLADGGTTSTSSSSSHHGVSPAIGGVIGAIVTLVVAGLLFAGLVLLGGFRLHRVPKGHKSELGGFKGGQKMASDKDLIIPKGGAAASAVETPGSPVKGGHERVGSWELKKQGDDLPNIAAPEAERRPSFEDDEIVDPFQRPVKADEHV